MCWHWNRKYRSMDSELKLPGSRRRIRLGRSETKQIPLRDVHGGDVWRRRSESLFSGKAWWYPAFKDDIRGGNARFPTASFFTTLLTPGFLYLKVPLCSIHNYNGAILV